MNIFPTCYWHISYQASLWPGLGAHQQSLLVPNSLRFPHLLCPNSPTGIRSSDVIQHVHGQQCTPVCLSSPTPLHRQCNHPTEFGIEYIILSCPAPWNTEYDNCCSLLNLSLPSVFMWLLKAWHGPISHIALIANEFPSHRLLVVPKPSKHTKATSK